MRMHRQGMRYLFAGMLWLLAGVADAKPLSIFQPGSYQAILAQQQGHPFVMVFWSLECTHCQKEMQMLGELLTERPQLHVVLISTDSPGEQEELRQVMVQYGLEQVSGWVFTEANSPRLRFEVDRTWYGELPRSYLFDAGHRRQAHSGILQREAIVRWADENR